MSLFQLSSVLLLVIFTVSVTSKDLIYYHTIKHLSSQTFLGEDVQNAYLLDMRNCDIETVASTTFTGMSKLKILLLLHNNIGYLPEDVFNSLEENLDYLRLDSNKLESIPKKLFAKIPKLLELRISYNLLSKFETGTFDKNVKLKKIFLEFNRLEVVPKGLFSKLTELVHLDISNNFINYIDNTALPNNLQELLVFSNRLRFINENHVKNLKKFLLDKNPLYCDCRLKQVHAQWANKFKYQGWTPNCAGPKNLYNIRWDKLSSNDFVCKQDIITLYPQVISVVAGQDVTLRCHVSGVANASNVKFIYGNNTEVRGIITVNNSWYNLTIPNVRKIDEEIYKCIVNENEMEVKVQVEEYPELKKLYKSLCKNDIFSYV